MPTDLKEEGEWPRIVWVSRFVLESKTKRGDFCRDCLLRRLGLEADWIGILKTESLYRKITLIMTIRRSSCPAVGIRAFTLIELLTVIAIIGILASILIPVVGKVRESAHRIQCGSNVRQIALAVLAYESDFGRLPGPTERDIQSPLAGNSRRGANLPKSAWPTFNVDLSVILEDFLLAGGKYHEGDPGPFMCTSNLENAQTNPLIPAYLLMRNRQTNPPSFFGDMDSGVTSIYGRVRNTSEIIAAGRGVRSKEATELTQIWMISDIDGGNYGSASGVGDDTPLTFAPAHDGGRNFAFFDAHLEFVKPDGDGRWRYPAATGDAGNTGSN